MLLLGPPREWRLLDDEPFRDIYDILEFPVPAQPAAWRDREPSTRLTVPLRLVPATTTEPAELWVLRDRGFEQVDELVRTSDDQLLARLAFAVADRDRETLFVLRARPSPQGPPTRSQPGSAPI